MPSLDLRRDLGWLLAAPDAQPPDETEARVVYGELRSLIEADPERAVFDSYESFADFYTHRFSVDAQGSTLLDRVQDFFTQVVDLPESRGEDVLYHYSTTGEDGAQISRELYVDCRKGETFHDALAQSWDVSVPEYMAFFDGVPTTDKLDRFEHTYRDEELDSIATLAERFDTKPEDVTAILAQLQQTRSPEQSFEILQNFTGSLAQLDGVLSQFAPDAADTILSQYPERVGAALKWEKSFGPAAVMMLLEYDFLSVLDGLHAADQQLILQRCFSPADASFRDECRKSFETYTEGDKYPYHRDYAVKLEAEFKGVVSAEDILGFLLTESSGDRTIDSPDGSTHGLMQMSGSVFANYHTPAPDRPNDIYNYKSNMHAGTRYLVENCLGNDNNHWDSMGIAIGNYNRGEGNMNDKYFASARAVMPKTTSEYITRVLLYSMWFTQLEVSGAADFDLST